MAANEAAQKPDLAVDRRVIDVHQQRAAGADHNHAILVDVVDAQHLDLRRQAQPFAVRHDSHIKAALAQRDRDLVVIVVG